MTAPVSARRTVKGTSVPSAHAASRRATSSAIASGVGTDVYQSSHSRPSLAAAASSSTSPDASGSSRTISPVSATGPARAMSAVPERAERLLAGLAGEAVEEDLAVEVVDLVLEAARHESAALDPQWLAVHVEALHDGVHRAHGGRVEPGHRQAPL